MRMTFQCVDPQNVNITATFLPVAHMQMLPITTPFLRRMIIDTFCSFSMSLVTFFITLDIEK